MRAGGFERGFRFQGSFQEEQGRRRHRGADQNGDDVTAELGHRCV